MSGDEPQEETGRLVLVVDADAVVRAWVAQVLETSGIGSMVAADGGAALRLVADGHLRPDVVVTEIELPGMSGVELAARLAAMRPGLRVVMMTADPVRAEAARDHTSLVATVLLKPLAVDDLVVAIRVDPAATVA